MSHEKTTTAATPATLDPQIDVRSVVREKYGAIAEGKSSGCCGDGCCGASDARETLDEIGYTPAQAAAIPEDANLGLGCGNPVSFSEIRPGETVLDLGSGG